MSINIDELNEAIEDQLTLYSKNVIDGVKTEAKKSMRKLVKQTKASAPVGKREKHYKDNITSKNLVNTANQVSYLWYVRSPDYRITHLLNDGHATRNGGRYEGTQFLTKAVDDVIPEYEHNVEEVIKNGE